MEERDHYLSMQYHQQLLKIAANERLARSSEECSPSRLERLQELSGDLLISLGQRLKKHALKSNPGTPATPDLSRECV